MLHKIRTFFRLLLLLGRRSKRPTGLVSLAKIRTAVVLRDAGDESLDRSITDYFKKKGIEVRLLSIRDKRLRSREDLFVAILEKTDFNERYAALSSTSCFKVGRRPFRGDVYDLVVSPAEGGDGSQRTVFEAITGYLERIR